MTKATCSTRDALLERMRDHIHTVVGRYKGRIQSWDVVNEALEEDGSLRKSLWLQIIGPDYIAKAFQFAHEADPAATLNYNDYALENQPKLQGAVKLIRDLKDAGVAVSVVGNQAHVHMDWPYPEAEDKAIGTLAALGVKVAITEFDVNILPGAPHSADVSLSVEARKELNPYPDGLPAAMQDALAKRYADLFAVFLKHRDAVVRVTFWGVTDAGSWLNNWPVRGRTNYPLLFDRSWPAQARLRRRPEGGGSVTSAATTHRAQSTGSLQAPRSPAPIPSSAPQSPPAAAPPASSAEPSPPR